MEEHEHQVGESSEEEDFMKVADLLPDMHHVNIILKTFQVEAVVVHEMGHTLMPGNRGDQYT